MNAARLLEHFERIAEAPNAIPRLRKFILDLAVRGKLVEQDSNDEPASELLRKIKNEKDRLVKIRCIKKARSINKLQDEDIPYDLPHGWKWSQLSEIGVISPRNDIDDKREIAFVPMKMIPAEYGVKHDAEIKLWSEIKTGFTHFAEGDVALAKITPCFENGKSTVFSKLPGGFGAGTTELHVVRPFFVSQNYVLIYLKSPQFIGTGIPKMTGTAGQKRVSTEYFSNSPFPLPPLTEQHRIVAKVDELMALCDRLEATQAKRESRRNRLATASLKRIGQPEAVGNGEEFQGNVRFHLHHLPRLTTRPEHVKELRQTILNLAVRGKLVPQDPNDRVKKIDIIRLVKGERKARGFPLEISSGSFSSFGVDVDSVNIPISWELMKLSEIVLAVVDCPHSTPSWADSGAICVRTSQFKPGFLDLSNSRYVSIETYRERIQRIEPQEDDILYSREGGILGVACRVPKQVNLCLGQRMLLLRSTSVCLATYIEIVLNSPFINSLAQKQTTGGAAPRINVSLVKSYPIPLPPLAEQNQIVAKVDELMNLCDQLEVQLATSQRRRSRLLEATLCEALGVTCMPVARPTRPTPSPVLSAPPRSESPFEVQSLRLVDTPKAAVQGSLVEQPKSPTTSPRAAGNDIPGAILAQMQPGQDYSRAQLVDALGLSVYEWNMAIRELKESGRVVQTGERRGAKYQVA